MKTFRYLILLSALVLHPISYAQGVFSTLEAQKSVKLGSLPAAAVTVSITANQNNYAPTGIASAMVLRVTTDASRQITGIDPGLLPPGRILMVDNIGTNDLVLPSQSSSSTAANRFAFNADVTLEADQSVVLRYDYLSSRWRLYGGSGSGGGGGAEDLIANEINDGETGVAPAQDAVFDALALKAALASPTFTGTVTFPTPFTLGAVSVLPTGTELNFVDGVTSAIQTQLDSKSPLASPTFTGTVTFPTPFTLGAVSVLPTGTELNFVDGVTSAIQTQLDAKSPLASPTFTGTVTFPTPFTLGAVSVLPTGTELNFVDGVTSAIQTQLDAKAPLASPTFTGTVTFPTPFTLGAVSVLPTGTELNFVDGVTSAIQTQLDAKLAHTSGTLTTGTLAGATSVSGTINYPAASFDTVTITSNAGVIDVAKALGSITNNASTTITFGTDSLTAGRFLTRVLVNSDGSNARPFIFDTVTDFTVRVPAGQTMVVVVKSQGASGWALHSGGGNGLDLDTNSTPAVTRLIETFNPTTGIYESSTVLQLLSARIPVELVVALSDETTSITTGTAKVTIRAPWAFTVTGVRASLNTVSSSGTPTVDINEGTGGGTTILSTKLTIDASELTSTTAAAAAVISDTAIADDAEITFDIDVAGTGAKGLKVIIYGYR